MRVSCDPNDPSYTGPIPCVEIRFNGEVVTDVITADEESGYLLRYQRQGGELMLNEAKDEILTEELRGRVEVIMPLVHG